MTPELERIEAVFQDAAQIGPVQLIIEEDDMSENAFAVRGTLEVHLTKGLLDAVVERKYSPAMLFLIIGHELGHLSPLGRTKAGTMDGEIFADYWGLLLLEEMRNDGMPIDLYEAISLFNTGTFGVNGGGTHPSGATRYSYLKEKLDFWKANEHRAPEAG